MSSYNLDDQDGAIFPADFNAYLGEMLALRFSEQYTLAEISYQASYISVIFQPGAGDPIRQEEKECTVVTRYYKQKTINPHPIVLTLGCKDKDLGKYEGPRQTARSIQETVSRIQELDPSTRHSTFIVPILQVGSPSDIDPELPLRPRNHFVLGIIFEDRLYIFDSRLFFLGALYSAYNPINQSQREINFTYTYWGGYYTYGLQDNDTIHCGRFVLLLICHILNKTIDIQLLKNPRNFNQKIIEIMPTSIGIESMCRQIFDSEVPTSGLISPPIENDYEAIETEDQSTGEAADFASFLPFGAHYSLVEAGQETMETSEKEEFVPDLQALATGFSPTPWYDIARTALTASADNQAECSIS